MFDLYTDLILRRYKDFLVFNYFKSFATFPPEHDAYVLAQEGAYNYAMELMAVEAIEGP